MLQMFLLGIHRAAWLATHRLEFVMAACYVWAELNLLLQSLQSAKTSNALGNLVGLLIALKLT
jgi:hypothetical protein